MTAHEAVTLMYAAGLKPLPGPWDGTWEVDVYGTTVRFGAEVSGVGWYAVWPGALGGAFVKAHGPCLISALKALVDRLMGARFAYGSAGAARRISELVTRLEAAR